MLTGTIRLFNGERWTDGTPGDFLYVPEGGVHAFRNESGQPASMLLHFAPGARDVDHPRMSDELQAEIYGYRGHQLNRSGDLRRHDLKANGLLHHRRHRVC